MINIEENIQKAMFQGNTEKTFLDKIFAKEDIKSVRDLIKKPNLSRSELLEILYLLSGAETKLINYSAWDRYVMTKFFVWIREFVKTIELFYDYKDDLEKKEKMCMTCNTEIKEGKCTCDGVNKIQVSFKLSPRTKQLFENVARLMEHNVKFLIDFYFNLERSSLSLGGMGFKEALTNKYEIAYPNLPSTQPVEEKKHWWK